MTADVKYADPLAGLKLERDAIAARLAELNDKLSRTTAPDNSARDAVVTAVEQLGAAELAELAELDKTEQNALRAWMASGSAGNPPLPDTKRREGLNLRLAEALKMRAAMHAASVDLTDEQATLNARFVAISERLYSAAIGEIARRAEIEHSAIARDAEALSRRIARVFGAVEFLRNLARQNEARNLPGRTNVVNTAVNRVDLLTRQNLFPMTRKAAFDHIPGWAKELDDLLK